MFDHSYFCDDIRDEFERCILLVGDEDPYESATTLGIHVVLRAHFLVANYFYLEGEGLAGVGPKDINLLHSALYRQFVSIGTKRKWESKFDICATLLFGLVMDHPFYDANKRTGFLTAVYYLLQHGRALTVSHKEFEDFIVDVADHQLVRYDRFKKLKKQGDSDPEIRFISYYLKAKTRDVDKRFYAITYRDLKRILNKFGCDIDNPHGNYIDVFKDEKVGFLRQRIERRRVAQIGFPGWGAQVGKGAIGTVRRETGLTPENGIDSQVFFRGLEALESLLAFYQEPLRRLADR